MSKLAKSVYTLALCVSLFAVGCGEPQDSATSDQSESAQSEADPQIPTVTLPDEDAGSSTPSTPTEDSTE